MRFPKLERALSRKGSKGLDAGRGGEEGGESQVWGHEGRGKGKRLSQNEAQESGCKVHKQRGMARGGAQGGKKGRTVK